MTPTDLRNWRKRLGLSQAEAAAALGRSLRAYQNLEAGTRPVRHDTALACAWIDLHGPSDPWT